MIYIRKIIYFTATTSFTIVVFLTLILFFYAAFFFNPPFVEIKTAENQITKSEEQASPSIETAESTLIEKVEPTQEFPKSDEQKVEDIIENSIEDFLYASVGNKAITQSDIINEIKIILILTGQSFTEDIKEQLHTGAIQSIIKRNIKKIEIGRYDSLTFNRLDVDKEIEKLADNLSMDYDTLKNTFIANGIDFAHIIDQIETELLWNSLIFELYKDKLTINLSEIDEQLRTIQNKKEINEYLISEIIIEPVPKDELESKIKEIKSKIKTEGFEKVAMNLSISETALKGGNLDWVNENTISEKFKSKIINTPIGNVSEHILLPGGILFFKVRDKRKVKKFENLEDAKNQLVNAEKTKILRMHALSHYERLRKSISINYH